MRRRAAFVAAALAATSATAHADQPKNPAAPVDAQAEAKARSKAEQHIARGEHDEALEVLFAIEAPTFETHLLQGLVLRKLGRFAAARTAYSLALPALDDEQRILKVKGELDDLRDRTAELTIADGAERGMVVTVDGKEIGTTPLPTSVFVDPGEHIIVISGPGHPATTKTVDVAGGARVALDMPLTTAQVCLSMMEPNYDRERLHWGVAASPEVDMTLVQSDAVFLAGASAVPFIGAGVGRHFSVKAGPYGGVFGSPRGFAARAGGHAELTLAPSSNLAIALGATAGYFYLPEEINEELTEPLIGMRTHSSFFVRPMLGFRVRAGDFEMGPTVGVLMSRAEDGRLGRFMPTYLSSMVWISYSNLPDPWE